MNWYKRWLSKEKEWIGAYQRKIMLMSVLKVIPATLFGLCIFFSVMTYINGGGIMIGIIGGVSLGMCICLFYMLILRIGLNPKLYVRQINAAVQEMDMNEEEKEQLAHEMLETDISSWQCVSFTYVGHGSAATPARFRITPHYAFLEGGVPYANLVRLSDVRNISCKEEKKEYTNHKTQVTIHEFYTAYMIVFDKNNADHKNLEPVMMEFYEEEIRDKVYKLIKNQLAENVI